MAFGMKINRLMSPLPEPKPAPAGAADNPCAACNVRMLSVCDALDEADLPRLAAISSSVSVLPHETLAAEGEPADHLFNLTDGAVKLYKLLPDGRQQVTGFLFAGDFLGLAASGRYAYSAESLTRTTYCRFDRRRLERLLDDFPRMERRLLGIASNELAAAQDQMLLLGRKTAREKLATFLVALARRMNRTGGPDQPLELPMTRTDIADYLGLTIETVSRTFSQFRKEKLIALPAVERVVLLDSARLGELAALA
jgi:CRP/FNR family transcriptional regulator